MLSLCYPVTCSCSRTTVLALCLEADFSHLLDLLLLKTHNQVWRWSAFKDWQSPEEDIMKGRHKRLPPFLLLEISEKENKVLTY